MRNCKNCKRQIDGDFCQHCGVPAHVRRIDSRYFLDELQKVFNFDRGIGFTVFSLLIRPGKSIREFIGENRTKYIKPVTFLIFTSLLFTIVASVCDINFSYYNINKITILEGITSHNVLSDWLQSYIGYINLIISVFIGLWVRLFFRKHGYNIFEIIILLCFIMGEVMLILSLLIVLTKITQSIVLAGVMSLFFFVYTIWAIGQFFGERNVINYFKAFLTYILGVLSYMAFLFLVGLIHDLFR